MTERKVTTEYDVDVGKRIRMYRSRAGMSQTELGLRVGGGISFQQIQKYEKGMNRVTIGRLKQIAEALKVPIEVLLDLNIANGYDSSLLDLVDSASACRVLEAFKHMSNHDRAHFMAIGESLAAKNALENKNDK